MFTFAASPARGKALLNHGLVGGVSPEGVVNVVSAAKKLFKSRPLAAGDHLQGKSSRGGNFIRKRNLVDIYQETQKTLKRGDEWLDVLREHRENGTQFTDPDFPPTESSLGVAAGGVHSWRRISDIYSGSTTFVDLQFFDDEDRQLCGGNPKIAADEFDSAEDEPGAAGGGPAALFKDTAEAAVRAAMEGSVERFGFSESMAGWLEQWAVFARRDHGDADVEAVDVRLQWATKPGYVSTVHCLCRVRFAAPRVALFQRGEGGDFVDPGDVNQGALGDCYFLGALSALGTHEQRVLDVFPDLDPALALEQGDGFPANEQQYNYEGVYCCRFWRGGKFRVVVVDDWLPCCPRGRPVFAHSSPARARGAGGSVLVEVWAALAEKAFAKLNGSYGSIISGHEAEALQDLTGGVPSSVELSGEGAEARFQGADADDVLWAEVPVHSFYFYNLA
jgi:hypothetical protein